MIVEDGGSGVIQKSFSQLICCPRSLSCIPLSRFKVDSFQRKEMRTRMDWKWCQMRKMMFATQGIQSMSIAMTYYPRIHSTMLISVQSHRDSYNRLVCSSLYEIENKPFINITAPIQCDHHHLCGSGVQPAGLEIGVQRDPRLLVTHNSIAFPCLQSVFLFF